MPTVLTTSAEEESTYIVNAGFKDENGDDVTPDSITWSLVDVDGNYINSRQDVSIAVPDSDVDIVLSGDDLVIQTGEAGVTKRYLVVKATYDSDVGSDLPLNDYAVFPINDLPDVS
jgi:hypothetical protein